MATKLCYQDELASGSYPASTLAVTQAVAANSSTTQAGGTVVLPNTVLVTATSAGAGYSLTLPASVPGMQIDVINLGTGSNTLKVFPNAGGTGTETINALSANAAITMAISTSATFICTVAGQWWTNPRVPS